MGGEGVAEEGHSQVIQVPDQAIERLLSVFRQVRTHWRHYFLFYLESEHFD